MSTFMGTAPQTKPSNWPLKLAPQTKPSKTQPLNKFGDPESVCRFWFLVRIFANTFRQDCLLRKIVVAFLLDISYNKSKHIFALLASEVAQMCEGFAFETAKS